MKALVLDAQTDAGMAVVQSLGRAGVEVHAVSTRDDCLAFSSRYARLKLQSSPAADPEQAIARVRELDAASAYTLIVPSAEHSLMWFQELPDEDPLRSKAVLAPRASIAIALSKLDTTALAARLGIPVPASTLIPQGQDLEYDGPYPVVLKTARSQIKREEDSHYAQPCIARHQAARETFIERWSRYSPIQQQAFCPGRGVGIECLYERGHLRWVFAHERLHELPLSGGASSYRQSIACPPGLLADAKAILDALHWHGVAMVEFRVDKRGSHVLLEINPRCWGSLPLAVAAGADFPRGLLSVAEGHSPGSQPVCRLGLRMRHLQKDLEWMRENWRADHTDALLLTQNRRQSVMDWCRPVLTRERWDHFSLEDPGPGLKQIRNCLTRGAQKVGRKLAAVYLRSRMHRSHARAVKQLSGSGSAPRNLLFVCFGNICRSPLAEYIARARMPGFDISSAGLEANEASCSPSHIQRVGAELGLDLSAHRPRRLTQALIDKADAVLIMDEANFRMFRERFPGSLHKLLLLGALGGSRNGTIADPVDMDDAGARLCAHQISESVRALEKWLTTGATGRATGPS